jgi:hypothetical protein
MEERIKELIIGMLRRQIMIIKLIQREVDQAA